MQSLGLNEQQARAYLALLDHPQATVNELSRTSRVPRAKLYEVLESLNQKGLVDIIPETPQRFRANPLSAFFDTRIEELRAEEVELKRAVGELMVDFAPQARAGRSEAERDFVHVLHGRPHFAVHLRRLVDAAQRSLVILGDRLFLARLRLYEDVVEALAARVGAVEVRILVPGNVVDEVDGRRVRLDELEPLVRRAPLSLGDVAVVVRDQEEFVVTRFQPNDLHPSRGSDRLVLGEDPEIAMLWHRLGNHVWESAKAWVPGRAA